MRGEWIIVIFSFICLLESVRGIRFHLQPNQQKCLRDEMNANMLVVGWVVQFNRQQSWLRNAFIFSEYEITAAPGQIIDYEVRDTKQHILSKKEDISRGKFSFTSEVFDVYELCFKSKVQQSKFLWMLTRLSKVWSFYFRYPSNSSRSFSDRKERCRDEVLWRREYQIAYHSEQLRLISNIYCIVTLLER